MTNLIFWNKFTQKVCFRSKTENINTNIEFCIFELILKTNFSLNWQVWFFGPSLSKKVISNLKRIQMNTTTEFCIFELVYNHFHNILRLFDILPSFPFTTSETKHHKSNEAQLLVINMVYRNCLTSCRMT